MDKSPVVKKVPLILITGFLGSGKTSLLKQILLHIGSSRKIAVVQNEFAPGRIDSWELESLGIPFDLLEVNNGSVFCACLLDDFIRMLSGFIAKYQPDAIFLEATGLADPVSLAQVLLAPGVENHIYLGGIWTVVDCVNFSKSHRYIQRVKHQIQIADLILLNKSEVNPPDEALTGRLMEWNPYANYKNSINGLFIDLPQSLAESLEPSRRQNAISDHPSLPVPDIGSCVIRSQKTFSEQAIRDFHRENQDHIFRMKGYLRSTEGKILLVQSVFDELKITQFRDWDGPTELILMGPGIKAGEISKEFLKYGQNAEKYSEKT